jgi:hypothetical protein
MRKKFIVPLLIGLFGLLPMTVNSIGSVSTMVEGEIDMDFMQDVEDTSINLTDNVAQRDLDSILNNASELAEAFEKLEAFYIAKGDAEDAVALSSKSKALSQQIIMQVDKQDFDAAAVLATELSRTCKACHNFYKDS